MWLTFAGRLHKEFAGAMNEYSNNQIVGYEMLEEFKRGEEHKGVTCISVLDAGLHTLRDWSVVRALGKEFPDIPILIYVRNEELLPESTLFNSNVYVKYVGEEIYLSALVNEKKRLDRQYKEEKLEQSKGVEKYG